MMSEQKRTTVMCRNPICAGYAAYEARKRQWDSEHPTATPAERDAAMMRIARECGV